MADEQTVNSPTPDVRVIAREIAQKLRAWPENWCQGAYTASNGARCLAGHLWPYFDGAVDSAVYDVFQNACGMMVSDWNDMPGRTVEEVIEVCERIANG